MEGPTWETFDYKYKGEYDFSLHGHIIKRFKLDKGSWDVAYILGDGWGTRDPITFIDLKIPGKENESLHCAKCERDFTLYCGGCVDKILSKQDEEIKLLKEEIEQLKKLVTVTQ